MHAIGFKTFLVQWLSYCGCEFYCRQGFTLENVTFCWSWLTHSWTVLCPGISQTSKKKKKKQNQLLWPSNLIVYIQRLLFAFIYHSLFNFKMYFLWISNCLELCTRHHEADVAAGNSNMVEALRLAEVWAAVTCCSCTLRKWGLKHYVPEQENINKSICNAARLLKYAQTLTVYSNGPGGLFVFTSSKTTSWPECRCYFLSLPQMTFVIFCSAGWSRSLHKHQQWCHKQKAPCREIIGGIRARARSVWLAAAVQRLSQMRFHTQRRFGSTDGATACWSEREDKTRVQRLNPSTAFLPAGCLYVFQLKVGLSCWVTDRAAWLRLHARVTAEVSSLSSEPGQPHSHPSCPVLLSRWWVHFACFSITLSI